MPSFGIFHCLLHQPGYPMRGAHAHIKAAAYHEAGHALAAIREGFRVELAQISRRVPGAGRAFIRYKPLLRNPFIPSAGAGAAQAAWEVSLQRRLPIIRVNLAGPLAEAKYLGQPLRTLGALSDLVKCQHIAGTLAALHQELADKYGDLPQFCPFERIAEERKRLRRWLARPRTWQTVTAIAEALIERGGLSEEELLQIYLTARSPATQPVLPLVEPPTSQPAKARRPDFIGWTHQVAQPMEGPPSAPILIPTKIAFMPWNNPEASPSPVRAPRRDRGLSWLFRPLRVRAFWLGVRIAGLEEKV